MQRPMHPLFRARSARGIALVLIGFAIVGSLLPPQQMERLTWSISDKWIHCLYYAGLTFFCMYSFEEQNFRMMTKISALVFLFGFILEILQEILPVQRNMDLLDLLANTVGILIANALAHFLGSNR